MHTWKANTCKLPGANERLNVKQNTPNVAMKQTLKSIIHTSNDEGTTATNGIAREHSAKFARDV